MVNAGKKKKSSEKKAHKKSDTDGQLERARERLYRRNATGDARVRTPLRASESTPVATYTPTVTEKNVAPEPVDEQNSFFTHMTKKGYRTKILLGAVFFFIFALLISSVLLLFGNATISGENIVIDVSAPFALGGGEELDLQISIMNRNTTAVESATLIVEYPPGTQSAGEPGRELFRDRIQLGTIAPGAVHTAPVKAVLFGEENEERTILVSIEYRVEGSNATFFTEAEPVRIKISSSPVVLSIDTLSEISSGQEIELVFEVASNASESINNALLEVTYPQGFDFTEADPSPNRGQQVWSIPALEPEGTFTVTVRGIMIGNETEERTFSARVGVPGDGNQYSLASVLTSVSETIGLKNPFANLAVTVNGSRDDTVSLQASETASVTVTFENTLSDTIRDGAVSVQFTGSESRPSNVSVSSGFYNSSRGTIVWDSGSVSGLKELSPGESTTVRFAVEGSESTRTPQISFDVSVAGRRVSENKVQQSLTNVVSRTVRFESIASVASHALYSKGPFTNIGPVPPVAEQVTQYAIMLTAQNGSNDLSNTEVRTTLPQYVIWGDNVSSGDDISYNNATREVVWSIGSLDAQSSKNAAFQVSILPSISQVGSVPTLIGDQRLRATDRFTGTVIRATAPAVRTNLTEDPDSDTRDGRVQAN